jgi:hypothetical protein
MSNAWGDSIRRRGAAVLAALVRSQGPAAASTALYRNQLIEPLPAQAAAPPRLKLRRQRRQFLQPVPVLFCPLLPPGRP